MIIINEIINQFRNTCGRSHSEVKTHSWTTTRAHWQLTACGCSLHAWSRAFSIRTAVP